MTSLNRSFLSFLLFLTLFLLICIPSFASDIKEEVCEASAVSAQIPYETLPVEIIAHMGEYLDPQDRLQIRSVSRISAAAVEMGFQRTSPFKYSLNLTKCLDSSIKHPQPYTISYFLRGHLQSILTELEKINQTRIHQLANFSKKWHYVGHDLFEALKDSPDIESFLKSDSCQSYLTKTEDDPDLREVQLLLHAGRCVFNTRSDLISKKESLDSLLLFARSLPSSEQKGMASLYLYLYLYELVSSGSLSQHNFEAIELWLEFCAEQGHVEAQGMLGLLYAQIGDISKAMKWVTLAANHGHILAQGMLGMFSLQQKNLSEAKKWFTLSADQGDESSQYNLGVIYVKEGNIAEARNYCEIIAKRGNKEIKLKLEDLLREEGS